MLTSLCGTRFANATIASQNSAARSGRSHVGRAVPAASSSSAYSRSANWSLIDDRSNRIPSFRHSFSFFLLPLILQRLLLRFQQAIGVALFFLLRGKRFARGAHRRGLA